METERLRRSGIGDRSRELPGPKKPRLTDETLESRASVNPRSSRREESSSVSASTAARGGGGGGVEELVAQYKTALSELTYNSKPIITNLTIIAGENLHAAKGIASAVCSNVLEVPSEQKLPSLYLLDSIVKNIGSNYIKYFAARLPEVFCKAYKQVDSSIHNDMRYLFGTWKGVFPPSTFQTIEKELGFPATVNGSSGSAAPRSDSQTQRPTNSIHVNPKYLEARHRLQQSTRAKEISNEASSVISSQEDAKRSERNVLTGTTRQWTDMPSRIHNIQGPQREHLNNTHEKKAYGGAKGHGFSSILPRQTDQEVRRISERIEELDDYGPGSLASEAVATRRNSVDANNAFENYRTSGFAQVDSHPPHSVQLNDASKISRPTPNNWKNSEEEEYMWDDINSKVKDYGVSSSSIKDSWSIGKADKPANLKRGQWTPVETEQPDFQQNKHNVFSRLKASGREDRVPLFKDFREHHLQPHSQQDNDSTIRMGSSTDPVSLERAASGHHASSLWPQHESLLSVTDLNQISTRVSGQQEARNISIGGGLSTSLISSLPRAGLLSNSYSSSLGPTSTSTMSGSGGLVGHQRLQALQPSSPPVHSPPSLPSPQYQMLHNLVDRDQSQPTAMQSSGHFNKVSHASVSQDSLSSFAQNHRQQSHILNDLHSPPFQSSQPSVARFAQGRHQPSLLRNPEPDLLSYQAQTQSQLLLQSVKPPSLTQSSGTPSLGFSGETQPENPVNIIRNSSTSTLLDALMKSGLLTNNLANELPNFNMQPPLPTGPPPILGLTSSAHSINPSTAMHQTSQANTPAVTPSPGAMLPPLPLGPPPSSLVCTSKKTDKGNTSPNLFSNLLSSLMSKGIIASPATELPAVTSSAMPHEVPDQISKLHNNTLVLVPSTAATSTIPSASVEEHSAFISEPSAPPGSVGKELDDLIGTDFKPEIIRELHPLVIRNLFDGLNYQCNICGTRFRHQEQLHDHIDWHAGSDSVSRKWFTKNSSWVAGIAEPPQVSEPTTPLEEIDSTSEESGPMVPADESQSICLLCGEPFEDYYSYERDEWMYKETVYFNSQDKQGDKGSMDESLELVIVHYKCMSTSASSMEVAEHDRVEPHPPT